MGTKDKICTLTKNEKGANIIQIKFPYDLDTIEQVRSLPGRYYFSEQTCWYAPLHIETIELLQSWGFYIDGPLLTLLKKEEVSKGIFAREGVKGLQGTLFPFQGEGVAFVERHHGRALIADEMGLGKTVQALAWLQLHPEKRPAVIVTPASLKLNWKKEIEKWMTKPTVEVLSGTKTWRTRADILIVNYDVLFAWNQELRRRLPAVLITDECHYYKSNSAKRTKAIKALAKSIPHVIALSGTPILNRPIEIYNALAIIDPTLFPNYWQYARRYCNAHHNGFGWTFAGASHVEELHKRLTSTVMIRRLKKDVLKELPDKIYSFVPIELDNEKEYLAAQRDYIRWVKEEKGREAAAKASRAVAFAKTEGLKQLAVEGKMTQAILWIRDFLEVGDKLVVFATHHFVINTLMEEFGKVAVKIDGSVSETARQKAVEEFQSNPQVRLFIGNIKAAGVGLTLTAASNVAFLELPWTPGELVQAQDRCHRIGQKDCVNIHYLLARGTIEEKIAYKIDEKQRILDAILDGRETEQGSLLLEIIQQYEEEN